MEINWRNELGEQKGVVEFWSALVFLSKIKSDVSKTQGEKVFFKH